MVIRQFEIGSGDEAIDRTIVHMQRLARDGARMSAIQALARSLKRGSDFASIRSAFDYVVRRMPYVHDPDGIELVAAPRHTLLGSRPYGDCDCMVTGLAALLLAMNYRAWFRVLAHTSNAYSHVNLIGECPEAQIGIALDPVMGASGFGNEKVDVIRDKIYAV